MHGRRHTLPDKRDLCVMTAPLTRPRGTYSVIHERRGDRIGDVLNPDLAVSESPVGQCLGEYHDMRRRWISVFASAVGVRILARYISVGMAS